MGRSVIPLFSSTAASLARGKKASKKNSLEAYLQSSNHDWLLDPPQQEDRSLGTAADGAASINKGVRQKVARNTVVRGSEPVYLDMFRHQQMVAAAAAIAAFAAEGAPGAVVVGASAVALAA